MVSDAGSFPASVKASRMLKSGMASRIRTSAAATPVTQARFWMKRLQRYQNPPGAGGPPWWRSPGTCSLSMALPEKPSKAGRRVSAARRTSNTATMQAVASPIMYACPMRKRPKREITTVLPAKSTDRPEVMMEAITASRGVRPSKRPCRYRVAMNSA